MFQNSPLISIIIPTFNRAHLIGETLDSILSQTYSNWECIVVDDDSSDNSQDIISSYIATDSRIKYYKRPSNKPKGGNACRNYGFELSKGEFIAWYDSDDLMLPENLRIKLKLFRQFNYDFIVSKSKRFFNGDISKTEDANHGDTTLKLNLENFAMSKVIWITGDIMFSRKTVKEVYWNEKLMAGQEYNFICKYLSKNPRGYFVSQVLSLRRMHSNSIRAKRDDLQITNHYSFHAKYQTFLELDADLSIKRKLLMKAISNYVKLKTGEVIANSSNLAKSIYETAGLYDVIVFYLMIIAKLLFNKYYRFYKILVRRAELS